MKPWFVALMALPLPLTALATTPEASREIDRVLEQHWQQAGVEPHPPASDEVFLRRIYLDAVGRIPTASEARAFLDSSHPDKRARLIDELLESPGYANHMFNWWADLLRLQTRIRNSPTAGQAYSEYVQRALAEDMPYDQFTSELITSVGFTWDTGAVGFYLRDAGMPLDHLATTVQVFLGTQVVCAQCHDHPFDDWSQMDYFHLAAFTYGINTRPNSLVDQREIAGAAREMGMDRNQSRNLLRGMNEIYRPLRGTVISETDRALRLPDDYQYDDARPRSVVEARVPFGPEIDPSEYASRTEAFADWMTDPDNPRFTLTIANRLWKRAFGLGLIEPVDDLNDRTVPAVPELMDLLQDVMRDVGYSQKDFLRIVFNTETYQREAAVEEVPLGETYHFTGPVLRRMTAEQAWDSIVTLVHGDPDRHTERIIRRRPDADRASAELQRLVAGITSRSPRQIIELARDSSRMQREASGRIRELTDQIREARERGDNNAARQLGRELNNIRNGMRRDVVAMAARLPGDSGNDRAGRGRLDADDAMMEDDAMMMSDDQPMMMADAPRRGGGARANDGFDQLLAAEIASDLGLDPAENRRELRDWLRGPARDYIRAAHLNQPAPRGHFLRLFGQSDREIIDNASPDGSIGQALNLLNGPLFNQLQHPLSALQRSVELADDNIEAQVDALYLNLLARQPSDHERALLREVIAERGESALQDITFALINGQEFLFVQ